MDFHWLWISDYFRLCRHNNPHEREVEKKSGHQDGWNEEPGFWILENSSDDPACSLGLTEVGNFGLPPVGSWNRPGISIHLDLWKIGRREVISKEPKIL